MQLGKPVSDVEGYGSLVDAMYKLIYEGSGACSRLPSPPPDFSMEVKQLRTGIRHDVDHGGKQKAAAKRKGIGISLRNTAERKRQTNVRRRTSSSCKCAFSRPHGTCSWCFSLEHPNPKLLPFGPHDNCMIKGRLQQVSGTKLGGGSWGKTLRIAKQRPETFLLKMPVVGENFGQPLLAHRLH
jgi:hypothetical protein